MSDLTLERTFAADPETVFSYVTEEENLLKWWGPEGMTVPEYVLDLTQPGPWSSVMVNAEGERYKVTGEVVAVDPPHSVELTWAWHDENEARGHESRFRFEVTPNGKKCLNLSSPITVENNRKPRKECRNPWRPGAPG